jgi:hypothetical protein
MAKVRRQYTAADLYGVDGRPRAADIDQDDVYNCYFLAPMGALGERQPDRIQDAIRFNAETGDFTVNLYRPPNAQEKSQGQTRPIQESITVSQEDIRRNIAEDGGGTVDNSRERNGPMWPTVIEAGFAELYGRNPKGEVNLGQGYRTIGAVTGGGALSDGMYALTGESGRSLQIQVANTPPMQPTGPDHVKRPEPPPFRAPLQGAKLGLDAVYAEVEQAVMAGKPVSMATQGRDVRDGLEESHAYMVVGVSRDQQNNEALITLRNPYGNNQRAGEGNQNIGAGWKDENPEITVSLNRLVRDGSFAEFNIGPAPRVQTQQPQQPQQQVAPEQTTPLQNKNETPNPTSQLNHPSNGSHPFHSVFNQASALVAKEDEKLGRKSDEQSERFALSATALALNSGMSRIDHMVFSTENKERGIKPGDNVILVQGGLHDPAHERAYMKTAAAINTPVEESLKQLDALQQRQTQEAPNMALQPTQNQTTDANAQRIQRMA